MSTLVLLPGMDGTGELFAPFLAQLRGVRTHSITYPTDQALNYHELTALAARQLPPNEPLILLGESFSGPIAIELARQLGARCRGLILCATFACSPLPLPAGVLRGVPLALLPYMPFELVMGRLPPPLAAQFKEIVRQTPSHVWRARCDAVLRVDVRAAFAQLRMPILYLCAEQDRLVRRHALRQLLRLQPNMTVSHHPTAHFLLQNDAANAARCVAAFVQRCANA
ncbi:MAG: alpha/beta fold hydrolase [Formosimonas sp.]